MILEKPLLPAILLRRYKRFLADVRLPDGRELTVHTPNTGSMLGCSEPGSRVWLRDAGERGRKYRYSWDMTETHAGVLVGVNTTLPNRLVMEGITSGVIGELSGYTAIRPEVRYGVERSRIDLLLVGDGQRPDCYVEIKNVTTCDADRAGFFPDAVSTRASRHLRELTEMVRQGARAVIFFCVQRGDVRCVRPADEIDPRYGEALRAALAAGVEALAWRARVTPGEIVLECPIPVLVP
ncbi:MAG TPA: DNA/RNA nuclease SfsA [Gammaproteobacteria bacterium]